MRRLLIVLTTCAFADAIGTMLVQGRSDTIKTLRDIVRHSSLPAHSSPSAQLEIRNPEATVSPEVIIENNNKKSPSHQKSKKTKNIRFIGKARARRHIGNVVVESGK
ncbi:unnamed protein product [Caenorhabditis brenneri]